MTMPLERNRVRERLVAGYTVPGADGARRKRIAARGVRMIVPGTDADLFMATLARLGQLES